MNYHVLVVEDDLGIRETLIDLLDSCGYKVSSAINGKDGWEKIQELKPHLVVSDIMMPVMDGLRLLEMIKSSATFHHLPVLILTAKVDQFTRWNSYTIGADAYVEKPFEAVELLFHINNLLALQESILLREDMQFNPELALKKHLFLSQLNEAIRDNMNDTSLDKIAQSMNLSGSGLQKKIKQYTPHTFSDYLKRYKLSKAKALLQSGKCNVSQSSQLSGFKNLAHFSDSFKEHFGLPPSKIVVQT
tara:strand:+ start:163 stop:900 length:738 start_codon:yes stop_codon:yes gene_type:complete